MMDKLKPCPFCGGAAKIHRRQFCLYSVCCVDTRCMGHNLYIMFKTKREAIEAWNRRESDGQRQNTISN